MNECRVWVKSLLCSVSSTQTGLQNNLPRYCYSKEKHEKQTPTYSEAKRPKCSNTHPVKILLYANYVHDDEALHSGAPSQSLWKEEIIFGMTLMLSVCALFDSNYSKNLYT
jgi:hypothetical protein